MQIGQTTVEGVRGSVLDQAVEAISSTPPTPACGAEEA